MANALPGEVVIDAARDIILAARDGDPNGQVQAGATSLVFDQAGGTVWQSHGGTLWTGLGTGGGGAYLPLSGGTLTGALTLNAGAQAAGMLRAKGWATGAETGLGTEIGVSGGTGYVYAYDRTAAAFAPLVLSGATVTLAGNGAGTGGVIVYGNGRVGIGGGSDVGYALHVAGSVLADSWLRVAGTAGLYFESYGGGWYMSDSSFIRTYNNKHIYAAGASYYMDDGGGLRSTSGVLLLGAAPYWGMYSSNTTTAGMALRFSDGTLLGMLYGDASAFGLLNNAAGWAVRILNGTAGGTLYGSWTVGNNLSVTGQVSANTGFFTGSVSVGGLSVSGYTVLRGRTGSATSVPTDLAPGEIYFGTP